MDRDEPELHIGDYVTIADSPDALTWQIIAIDPRGTVVGALYTLESGQTTRRRYETVDTLTPYKRIYS